MKYLFISISLLFLVACGTSNKIESPKLATVSTVKIVYRNVPYTIKKATADSLGLGLNYVIPTDSKLIQILLVEEYFNTKN